MQSVGIELRAPVILLTDGGNAVNEASRLPAGTEWLLAWFLNGTRFERLQLTVSGPCTFDDRSRGELLRQVERAKWLLWHGKKEQRLNRLQALRWGSGLAGVAVR